MATRNQLPLGNVMNAKNLGKNIVKGMQNTTYQAKKNARMGSATPSRVSNAHPQGSLSVPPNHRVRRYFGIKAPGAQF